MSNLYEFAAFLFPTGAHRLYFTDPFVQQQSIVIFTFPRHQCDPAFCIIMDSPAIPLGERGGPHTGLTFGKENFPGILKLLLSEVIPLRMHLKKQVI